MNELHTKLFTDLIHLCDTDEAFFYSEQVLKSKTFYIFNYRLANYTQWLNDGALECRGITFEVDENGNAVKLVSWPFEKFFNLNENPFTMNMDLTQVVSVVDKMDGSLISTMNVDGNTWLKSKGSLFSEQATDANAYFHDPVNSALKKWVDAWVGEDATVIFEWTGPQNRIVLSYAETKLTILGIRDNSTGDYLNLNLARIDVPDYVVVEHKVDDVAHFVEVMDQTKGIEGYILMFNDGQRVKVKTEEYRVLHRIKDSINSQRRLFEACVHDTADDIRATFFDDAVAVALIDEMDAKVSTIYNHMVDSVERFYAANKVLDKKEFAILGQAELEKMHFGLAMGKYIGREPDYKAAMIKNRKNFGIKDDPEKLGR